MPATLAAQENAQPAQSASQPAQPAAANPSAPAETGSAAPAAQQPARRPIMRKIENREFSNKDKILLLLSAHCDFPSKEDLISSINTDMLQQDKAKLASQNQAASANALPAQSNETSSSILTTSQTVAQSEVEDYLQEILFSILLDEKQLFSVRRRSLEALAYFDTPKNVKTLEYIVTHPESIKRPLMLVQAIRSYPQVAPDKAPEDLAPYLDSPNDMIRFVTISTLQNTPGQKSLDVLKKRRNVEKNHFFQNRLDDAIANHCKKDVFCSSTPF